jgi:uncharacterized membrane protein YozB (DUF420 family)
MILPMILPLRRPPLPPLRTPRAKLLPLPPRRHPIGSPDASPRAEDSLDDILHYLPTVNATLNATATVLLVAGYVLIKRKPRRETAHKRVMLTAFFVSIAVLVGYLVYHYFVGSVRFQGPTGVRIVYFVILISHILLAVTVPVLAGVTIYLGYRDRRPAHRRWAKWTFPIWLYVSVTGVVIYLMLYHLYPAADFPAAAEASIIEKLPQESGEFP